MVAKKHTSKSEHKVESKAEHKKPAHKKPSSSKHKTKPKKAKKQGLILKSILAVIIVILVIWAFNAIVGKFSDNGSNDVAAKIADDVITVQELNDEYEILPDVYKGLITKRNYLENAMIPQKLLLMQAEDITDEEVEAGYAAYLETNGIVEEDLLALLSEQNVPIEKFKDLIKVQIHLNETLGDSIEVSEEEVAEVYESQKDQILDEDGETLAFEDVSADIEAFLREQKLQEATNVYLEELKNQTDIEILYVDVIVDDAVVDDGMAADGDSGSDDVALVGEIKTFDVNDDEVCTEDGKPVIYLFSTTWCPHCKWITETFESTVEEYVDAGQIVAYHWEIDINDDTLTDAVEGEVPAEHMEVYQKYNPKGSLPTFVFGCKYSRVGNGYERDDDLASEAAEFRAVIEDLIA